MTNRSSSAHEIYISGEDEQLDKALVMERAARHENVNVDELARLIRSTAISRGKSIPAAFPNSKWLRRFIGKDPSFRELVIPTRRQRAATKASVVVSPNAPLTSTVLTGEPETNAPSGGADEKPVETMPASPASVLVAKTAVATSTTSTVRRKRVEWHLAVFSVLRAADAVANTMREKILQFNPVKVMTKTKSKTPEGNEFLLDEEENDGAELSPAATLRGEGFSYEYDGVELPVNSHGGDDTTRKRAPEVPSRFFCYVAKSTTACPHTHKTETTIMETGHAILWRNRRHHQFRREKDIAKECTNKSTARDYEFIHAVTHLLCRGADAAVAPIQMFSHWIERRNPLGEVPQIQLVEPAARATIPTKKNSIERRPIRAVLCAAVPRNVYSV
ncbi:hypothetical protein ON010_g6809 [Phytophthora cinnamomi]|nr:hypothetical protein ON010_g6809 [Phytophthora cinnamomi]